MSRRLLGSVSRWIGAILCGWVISPAALPAQVQDTISDVTDTVGVVTVPQLQRTVTLLQVDTLVVVDTVVVTEPCACDTLPVGFTLVASDDTLGYIVGVWADTMPDGYRMRAWDAVASGCPDAQGKFSNCNTSNMLAGREPVSSGDTLLVPLQASPITATVLVAWLTPSGGYGGSVMDGSVDLPAATGSVITPPPVDTTTPPPSGGGSAGHVLVPTDHSAAGAHEPSGMTPSGLIDFSTGTLVSRNPGSSFTMKDHSTSGVVVSGGGSNGSRVRLVQDAQKGQVLEFEFPQGCMGTTGGTSCGNNLWGETRDMYRVQYVHALVWVSGQYWVNKSGNKFLGMRGFEGGQNSTWRLKQHPQTAADWGTAGPMIAVLSEGGNHCGDSRTFYSPAVFPRGQWVDVEMVYTSSTGPCVADGRLQLWVNGVLAVNAPGIPTYDPNGNPHEGALHWKGVNMHPIAGGNCNATIAPCPDPGHQIRVAEIYVSGK